MSLIIPDKRLDTEINCIKFPYRLDDFQINGIHGINNDANILITAHTSAGKSTLAEYAVAKSLSLNKKVIYTSPIKTLSNQKYYDFKKTIDNIGIITGDIKLNPEADCLIMTTEILRNKLDSDDPIFDDLHCVIFDEVHYFNDPDRGFVWEECLAKLPKNIILVMLSATIDKAEEFGKWICDLKEKDTYLIGTLFRPVPLTHYLYTDDHLLETYSSSNLNKVNLDKAYAFYKSKEKQSHKANTKGKLESISKYLNKRNLFPSIFFSFSRKKCNEYCSFLRSGSGFLTPDEKNEINKYLQQIFSTNLKIYKDLPSTVEIIECIKYGVAVHHSGLLPVQKEIIEILFLRGLIKILFATETFAVGVNMPTKTVVFTELSKYDGISEFPRVLRSDEFLQMSGRAGRRGKDDKGYVVYFPLKKIEDKSDIVRLYKGKPRKLVSQYNEKNNLLIRLMNNKKNIKDFYLSTMFGNEIKKTTIEIDDEINYLNGLLEKNIDFNLSIGKKHNR